MKTILIVIAGMADMPDPNTLNDTPLTNAMIPALDTLASRGELNVMPGLGENDVISHKNALLSILGYDLERGEPEGEQLMEYGLDDTAHLTDFHSLNPFVIPVFSGHGVCITPSAWVRGVAKCAMLKPVDIYSPGAFEKEILETMASLATEEIIENEFVFIYVDSPLKASLAGNYNAKVNSLEMIDRYLITPIADYVWKSDLMINLAITTDLVTPWHRQRPAVMNVPVILYFNNDDKEGDPDQRFTEVEAMLREHIFNAPSDLIRYLSNFNVSDEPDRDNMPF